MKCCEIMGNPGSLHELAQVLHRECYVGSSMCEEIQLANKLPIPGGVGIEITFIGLQLEIAIQWSYDSRESSTIKFFEKVQCKLPLS